MYRTIQGHDRGANGRMLLASLALSLDLAILALIPGILGSEPFRNWDELRHEVIAVESWVWCALWLLCFFAGSAMQSASRRNELDRHISRRLIQQVLVSSLVLLPFSIAQVVLYCRNAVDFIAGKPLWFDNWIFDVFGSPAWLLFVVFILSRPALSRLAVRMPRRSRR